IVDLHSVSQYRPEWRGEEHLITTVGRIIFNDRIERALEEALGEEFDRRSYSFINQELKKRDTTKFVDDLVQQYGASTIAQVLDAFKDLGFHYATQAGITISKNDVVIPPNKEQILDRYEQQAQEIHGQ